MPTLTIGDKQVTVGDEFLKLSPGQQNSTVDEIAKSLNVAPEKQVSTLGDVAKSFGRGVAKGTIGILGAAGDVAGLVGRGMADSDAIIAEAQKRGLISAEDSAIFAEAQKRGILPKLTGVEPPPPPQRGAIDKLFGITGERYHTFPEQVFIDPLRKGGELTEKAMTGKLGEPGSREFTEKLGPEEILNPASVGMTAAPMVAAQVGGQVGRGIVKRTIAEELAEKLPKEKFKAASKAGYKEILDSRVVMKLGVAAELDNSIDRILYDHGMTADNAPGTFSIVKNVHKGTGDVAEVMATYERLGNITPDRGTDYAAASFAQDAIGRFLENLPENQVLTGDPKFTSAKWKQAKGDWWAYKKLEMVEKAETVGRHRADVSGTGANYVNAVKQRFREIIDSDVKSRGLPQNVKNEMLRLVEGSLATDAARYVGKTFAPLGPVTTMGTMALDLATNPKIAATFAGAGIASHYLAKYLTTKQIREIETLIRKATPQGQSIVQNVESRGMPEPAAALQRGTPALIPAAGALATGAAESPQQ